MADHTDKLRKAFGKALRTLRKTKSLTQEDFALVSSRTYLSTLERGMKSPTLEKIDALSEVLGVHPLTLLSLCYQHMEDTGRKKANARPNALIDRELDELGL